MNASVGCKQDLKYISAKLSVKCKCQRIQKECRSRLTSLTKNVYNEKQVKDEGQCECVMYMQQLTMSW